MSRYNIYRKESQSIGGNTKFVETCDNGIEAMHIAIDSMKNDIKNLGTQAEEIWYEIIDYKYDNDNVVTYRQVKAYMDEDERLKQNEENF